jgi:diguanylate cyclase (GGDEF)-like protein/PAS domain S-box-containing protein
MKFSDREKRETRTTPWATHNPENVTFHPRQLLLERAAEMNVIAESFITRLLLVDDDHIDRLACRRALEQSGHGFAVVEAETAEQGLRLARSGDFDCIVLDHYLPDFNGLEFLADLGEPDGELPVPVVILTCTNDAAVAVRALKLGASDYVVKDASRKSLEWIPAIILKALREWQSIREKKKAEEELREAEAKFRTLVEQIPAITYIASLENPGKLLYVSPQAESLGYPAKTWLDDPEGLLRWVHPDDREQVIEQFAGTYEHHAPLRCEYRLLCRDGRTRWILDEANVVRGEDGQAMFLQGILVDITQDKEIERELEYCHQHLEDLVAQRPTQSETQNKPPAAITGKIDLEPSEHRQGEAPLRASEVRFRSLLESAGEGIFGVDADGCCTFANKAAAELFGYLSKNLEGRDMIATLRAHRIDGESALGSECPLQRTLLQGVPSRFTETLRRSDGSSLVAEFSAHPIQSETDPAAGAVVLVRDVSEVQALTQRLSYEASHDALTGLLNRAEFERRVATALATAHENRSEHALCFLDLDRFKQVNDTCGHAAGDQLLQSLALLMESRLRQRDTLARLGGDEFGLLLEHCPIEQAWVIANELREATRSFRFPWAGEEFSVGMSVGIVALNAMSGDVGSVLSAADTACYVAKRRGRDRVHILETSSPDLLTGPVADAGIFDKAPDNGGLNQESARQLTAVRAGVGIVRINA